MSVDGSDAGHQCRRHVPAGEANGPARQLSSYDAFIDVIIVIRVLLKYISYLGASDSLLSDRWSTRTVDQDEGITRYSTVLGWTHVHVRACYRICRVYLPIIVDRPDAFLFALSVEPVVLFIYLFSWSCSPPEHDHIPQFDECGIE